MRDGRGRALPPGACAPSGFLFRIARLVFRPTALFGEREPTTSQ